VIDRVEGLPSHERVHLSGNAANDRFSIAGKSDRIGVVNALRLLRAGRPPANGRVNRWRRIAVEAAEQCGRTPPVVEPQRLIIICAAPASLSPYRMLSRNTDVSAH
jgi:hypothetical protein